ncbi:hypothetical protein YC2023_106174 [Brassica napus]
MDDSNRLHRLRSHKQTKFIRYNSEEVTSIKWEFINMTEQEEDLISRMYRLVGNSNFFKNLIGVSLSLKQGKVGSNSGKSGRTKSK